MCTVNYEQLQKVKEQVTLNPSSGTAERRCD